MLEELLEPKVIKQVGWSVDELEQALDHYTSLQTLAIDSGISKSKIMQLLKGEDIVGGIRELRAIFVKNAFAKERGSPGKPYLKSICEMTDLKPRAIWKYVEEQNIEVPEDLVPYRFNPPIDDVVDRGLSLNQGAKLTGMFKQSLHDYIMISCQQKIYERNRLKMNF